MFCKVKVENISNQSRQYVVARLVDGKLWYWGSWDDKKSADKVAMEFSNGIVVENID